MRKFLCCLFALSAFASSAETYVGVAGAMRLRSGGTALPRTAGVELRGGTYLSNYWAGEFAVGWLEREAAFDASFLGHWASWELYDRYFGFSAFDPFITIGAKGWIGREGQVGPKAGLGVFYRFDEHWSLRADADMTLGVDSRVEPLFSLSIGVQYTF